MLPNNSSGFAIKKSKSIMLFTVILIHIILIALNFLILQSWKTRLNTARMWQTILLTNITLGNLQEQIFSMNIYKPLESFLSKDLS